VHTQVPRFFRCQKCALRRIETPGIYFLNIGSDDQWTGDVQ
jgi:hypothetical protein